MGLYLYDNKSVSKSLTENLYEMHKSGEQCDFTLKTEDGGCFTVHKWILMTVSPFFKKLFHSEFNDKESDSIVLRRCSSSDVLTEVIKYMYTGKITITSGNIKDILDATLFLGINDVVEHCSQILLKFVNKKNCFELLNYSETYYCGEKLADKCIKLIFKNFNEMVYIREDEFLEISFESMKLFLKQDRNNVNDEQNLYLAAVKWLTHDLENRKNFIDSLMNEIKFENFTHEFISTRIIEKSNPLMNYLNFTSRLIRMIDNYCKEEIMEGNGCNTIIEIGNIYAFIGNQIIQKNNRDHKFRKLITNLPDARTWYATTYCDDGNICISGGKLNELKLNDCFYYSLKENHWKDIPSMNTPREGHRMLTLNNKIYSCGGINERTTEIFDMLKMKWLNGPSFVCNIETKWFGLCTTDENIIYAVCGKNFQYLDIRVDSWEPVPSITNRTTGIFSAIAHNNFIYGFNRDGIERFDLRQRNWLDTVPFIQKYDYNFPSVCISNNKFYIFAKTNENCKYLLQTHNLSDLSLHHISFIELNVNNYCWDLLSIKG